jgi:CheY-like chemotaxis protein
MVVIDFGRHVQLCDVLIVEDNVALSDEMEGFLERNGLAVCTAVSGTAALELLKRVRPRVAVFDYSLPDTNGLDLARQLRQRFPKLLVILMSGGAQPLDSDELKAAGVKVFVNKPVPLRALLGAVRQLIDGRS